MANKKKVQEPKPSWESYFIFLSVGAYFFFCSLFNAEFAKLHLSLSALKIPIFVGEIILFLCLVVTGIALYRKRLVLQVPQQVFLAYFAFIVAWAFLDFFRLTSGPLAFRNAALFMYPIFAFFTYSFYSSKILSFRSASLLAILLFLTAHHGVSGYFAYIYLVLTFALFLNRPLKGWEYALAVLLLVFWPYGAFLSVARTWLVASALASIFVIVIYLQYYAKLDIRWKIGAGLVAGAILFSGIIYLADKGGLQTLITPAKVIEEYQEIKAVIKKREPFFRFRELKSNLYNSQKDNQRTLWNLCFNYGKFVSTNPDQVYQEGSEQFTVKNLDVSNVANVNPFVAEKPDPNNSSGRDVQGAHNNTLFRLLIWEDMLTELWQGKKVFGVGLGHPQRSRSIEILNWAPSEWKRDGWITPHNSFLHLIYRAGLIGLAIIILIFVGLYRLVKDFIRFQSGTGLLLCGIIVFGLISANFLLILELPYFAIPFWTIVGIALAYRRDLMLKESNANRKKKK